MMRMLGNVNQLLMQSMEEMNKNKDDKNVIVEHMMKVMEQSIKQMEK